MFDYKYRLVLLGNSCTGKSTFANKLCNNRYLHIYEPTIGVDYYSKNFLLNNELIKCQIWDTAGQKKFAPILQSYYNNIAGVIFIFDLNKKTSFNDLKFWLNELNKNNKNNKNNLYSKLLIGNRTKRENKVSNIEINKFCIDYDFLYTEIDFKNDKHFENYLLPFLNHIQLNKEIFGGIEKFSKTKILEKDDIDKENVKTCCCFSFF